MASRVSYGGSESWSVWSGRSSALGTFSMLASGIGGSANPSAAWFAFTQRESVHTSVFRMSPMGASAPHMSP